MAIKQFITVPLKSRSHWDFVWTALCCSLFTIHSSAQWLSIPTPNNAISTAAGSQGKPQLVSDGSGGAIITWEDYSTYDIYAQRIDAAGVLQWTANGVAICTANDDQSNPRLISDGSGGAIITWQDHRSGNDYDIYAQRINASGVVQWTANGIAICTASGYQWWHQLVSDGSGGAIIVWQDYRIFANYDIYAQKINASGVVQWTANGVAVCAAINGQAFSQLISDGSGGAIITWQDYRSGNNYDIYAQRINASGVVQWTANGVAIRTGANDQEKPQLVSDGSGGAIITWMDNYSIYVQRINASGVVQWTANGVAICTLGGQYYPRLVSDSSGGAIITWYGGSSIQAQRINASGVVQWTANGVAICTANGDQSNPRLVSDGSGGAIITWQDSRSSGIYDIYAQRIDAAGAVQWTANGMAVCTAANHQEYPEIIRTDVCSFIITWQDARSVFADIYASKLDCDGGGIESVAFIVTKINSTCNGLCDGTATATPSGGTAPYTYLWSNSGTDSVATGLCAGKYYITVYDAVSDSVIDSITVTEPAIISTNQNATICAGDSAFLQDSWQTTGGIYYDTLAASNGCDSIIQTTLSVNISYNIPLTAAICNGDSMFLQNSYQTTTGIYYDTLTSITGCDSIITTSLTAASPIVINITSGICQGDSILLEGSWQTTNGTYYDTLTSATGGCDSILATTLTVDSAIFNSVVTSICPGDSIQLPGGNWVNTTGAYYDTLTASAGCDSIIQTNLSLNSTINIPLTASICTGDSIFLQGNYQTTAGTYFDTLTSVNGCDSILATTLSVDNNITVPLTANICAGDSIFIGDGWQTTPGTYYDTLAASNGCDSILAITLSVPAAITLTLNFTDASCGNADGNASVTASGGVTPYTYQWDGPVPPYGGTSGGWNSADSLTAGTYTVTVTDSSSCQQTATVNISNAGPPDATISSLTNVTCNGGNNGSATVSTTGGALPYSYLWSPTGGTDSTATGLPAGIYTVTITDNSGCIEIVDTTISEPTLIQNATATNICMGDSIFLSGSWQTTAGTYYDTLSASGGCDSILTTTLSVNNNITIPLTASICTGDSIFLQGNYQTTAGTYYDTLISVSGCDSILATALSVDSVIFNSVAASLCPGDSIQLPSGNWVNSAGVYYDTLTAGAGCDSIVQIILSVNISYNIPLTASICTGDSIYLQGNYQTAAGTYYDTLSTVNGCDSILSTTLSIDSAIFNSVATSLCPGDSIQLPSGNWVNSAGVYYDTLTAGAGCDSIVQIILSVNISYNIPLTASICTGDSIYLQGNYQTAAGTYYDTLSTVNGCDSILATTLSVDSSIFNAVTIYFCPGDSVQLPAGNWVNTAGIYFDTLTASAGCDSIIQTNLSLNSTFNIPLIASICTGDSIFLQGNYQNTAGTYYDTLSSINGCDSVIAATLTINQSTNQLINQSICNGDSIYLQNAWQTNAGTYNDTLVASNGCDSVVTATLAVNPTATATAIATLCQGDSVFISGEWVNVAGTYYDSLLTASGCDSIIAIRLTIDSIPVVTVGKDTTITAGISIQIVATGGSSYLWSNGETSPGITVSPEESTTYYVTVSDANGCAATDSVKITVDISKCTVFVPTIFTPNGDGKNDVLYVRGYGLKELEFMIYDRWGEKVFEYSGSPLPSGGVGGGPGWDGTFRKKELNTAVFVYMLKAVCFNGELIEEKGNITLVK